MEIWRSVLLFVIAGVCEIGGGYLVWLCLREGKPAWIGVLGALILIVYGVVPTMQTQSFGRVYAAYGGVFIALSLLWGWKFDGIRPDNYDWIGAAICSVGVAVIYFAPRS
jgi:small multidrug resistance family-3 protein